MKYAATLNAVLALASMLACIYTHDLNLAGAWASALTGWVVVAANAWWGEQ